MQARGRLCVSVEAGLQGCTSRCCKLERGGMLGEGFRRHLLRCLWSDDGIRKGMESIGQRCRVHMGAIRSSIRVQAQRQAHHRPSYIQFIHVPCPLALVRFPYCFHDHAHIHIQWLARLMLRFVFVLRLSMPGLTGDTLLRRGRGWVYFLQGVLLMWECRS